MRQIEANYHSLLNHAEINDDFNLDDYVGYSESQKKNIVHETYLKCFGSGLSNDIKYLYRLSVFYKNYDKKCINYVLIKNMLMRICHQNWQRWKIRNSKKL